MRRAHALALTLSAFLAAAPRANGQSFGHDPYSPVVLQSLTAGTLFGSVAADGSGGMLISWNYNNDIYVQRLTSTGAVYVGWPSNGLLVCNASGTQSEPALLGDGAGGAIIAWTDGRGTTQDIYATRFLGNATFAPGWPVNGVLLSANVISATKDDAGPQLASDGAGGAFVVWTLYFGSTDQDSYGARVTSGGSVAWNFSLYSPLGLQNTPKVLADESGGFFVGFVDNENGVHQHSKVTHFNSSGATLWGPKYIGAGVPTADASDFDVCADGTGGIFAVVSDGGPGTYFNIIGNHYLANGNNDPTWGGYKFLAFMANDSQGGPRAVPDGAGGFIFAFTDSRYGNPDLFALRIGPYGLPYSGWPAGGVALAVAPVNQFPRGMVSDGAGGAVIAFLDDRLGVDYFVYAVRVLGNGAIAPGWAYGGNPANLGGMVDVLFNVGIVSDGNGGALLGWNDSRGTTSYGYEGVYAQNMDRFGQYGVARPIITKIADVPNDQGGEVSLQWSASYLDSDPSRTVAQYSVWRRVPGGTAAEARAKETLAKESMAAANAATNDGAIARPAFRTATEGNQVIYWEFVATEPARLLPGYSKVVPTTSDSMTAGNARTSLMVMAESAGGQMFWQSAPDSGYSVDNIPPYAPAPFAGTYGGCSTAMHWRAEDVQDLANYRLYRGTNASFVPSQSNRIASPTDTAFIDASCQTYYYRLTAVDIHGNESASTLLLPAGATAVDGTLPRELAFAAPEPNPARDATTLEYALPQDATVRLAIYDLGGRRVRMLASGAEAAGNHVTSWDLRDDAGRAVRAGLYFIRFEAEGKSFTRRVMAVR
jgi:hypothetical protein